MKGKPRFLGGSALWSTLRDLARKSKQRRYVVAPYIGVGAANLLKVKRGDVLLCALSEANARAGVVVPAELKALQKRGVNVYVRERLHAKVYLFGRAAIVCSANMSTNSARLDEAGILSTDAATVSDVREWVLARLTAPLTPEWLRKCAAVYRPARGPNGTRGKKKRREGGKDQPTEIERKGKRLWMIRLWRVHLNESEETAREAGEKVAKRRLSKPRRFQVEDFRWQGDDSFGETAHRGDRVIQVLKEDDGRVLVHPVGRLVHVKPFTTRRGNSGSFIFLEMPRTYRRRGWADVRKALREEGLEVGKQPRTREVRDPVMDDRLSVLLGPRA